MGGTPIFRWFLVHDENNIKKKKKNLKIMKWEAD
jgi:hypothetical protein